MKKIISLLLVLAMCLSLGACGSSSEPETAELTINNFEEYLNVTFEIKNFNEGRLAPEVNLYNPTFDLVVNVEAVDSEYKFADTVMSLILTDKANVHNMDLGVNKIGIVIDENGNGKFAKEGITWTASDVAEPQYEVLTAVSTVSGIATKG